MFPAWATTLVSSALGAFLAAWAGTQLGFRKSRKERALDRKITWHEEAIQGLADYEERLERLRRHALNELVVQRTNGRSANAVPDRPEDIPQRVKAPAVLWAELGTAEARARAALRLGDLYAEGRTQLDCSVALSTSVNMVSSHWMDVSTEPEIPWADLRIKEMGAARVRRSLQESLSLVLELDGFLASVLGTRYRRWRTLRGIRRLQAEITSSAS